ncbi:MAG: calcium-binding protein [Hyphomicrobiaceae bacterium]
MAVFRGTGRGEKHVGTRLADVLYGVGGNDTLIGGLGNDTIRGGAGHDRLSGGDGADRLYGDSGNDKAYGGRGNDLILGGSGRDLLKGESGNDTVDGGSGNDTIHGGDGADRLKGSTGDDRLYGGRGNDRMDGQAGRDQIHGGDGNDTISGDGDADRLFGENGNDRLVGGTGNDRLEGGSGVDTLLGGDGDDVLVPDGFAVFDDIIDGGDGIDTLDYSAALGVVADLFNNTFGFDAAGDMVSNVESVVGSEFDDVLAPLAGGTAFGGPGSDQLKAFNALGTVSVLEGGDGVDTMDGSAADGSVHFVVNLLDSGADTIIGFSSGSLSTDDDKIALRNFGDLVSATNVRNDTSGHAAMTATPHELIYQQDTGELWYDADGVAGGEVVIAVFGDTVDFGNALSAADFILI